MPTQRLEEKRVEERGGGRERGHARGREREQSILILTTEIKLQTVRQCLGTWNQLVKKVHFIPTISLLLHDILLGHHSLLLASYLRMYRFTGPFMVASPITSWEIDGETVETVADFIILGSRITVDGDCSHEIKRRLLLGRKVMTNLDSIFKSRDITLPTKIRLVKAMVFPVVMYGCESWTVKKAEC